MQSPLDRLGVGASLGTRTAQARVSGEVTLPADLREWLPPTQLLAWVQDEVAGLKVRVPQPGAPLSRNLDQPFRTLLTLLAYAYATGTLSHEAIVRACHVDQQFREVCAGEIPFPHELRYFRRANRQLIEQVLEEVFRRTLESGRRPAGNLWLPDPMPELRAAAAQRVHTARHLDTDE